MPEGDTEWVSPVSGVEQSAAPQLPESDAPQHVSESMGVVAAAAAAQTPGLVEGAVANSLTAVMSLAESQNPELAVAFRSVLETIAENHQAATPAQVLAPRDTIIGGA